MKPEDLIARYPRLWHMADSRNLRGILERGLLSTSALLDLFQIRDEERAAIELRHRPNSVPIEHPRYGSAIIRDQKPMSVSRIEASLQDATAEDFFRFLNGRVFFWLSERRLATMNSARAYRPDTQVVLVVPTRDLVCGHASKIRLSPMNSGATSPFAHPRSLAMFRPIEKFDFAARAKTADPIAELTVEHDVSNVMELVERVELWRGGDLIRRLNRPYDRTLVNRISEETRRDRR